MSTRRLTIKAGRMLAPTIFFAAAILATAPDTAFAQRGLPGNGPGGQGHAAGAPSGFHGHLGGWRGGVPGGWRGAGVPGWHGGFGSSAPGWPWGWGFPVGGFAYAAPAPSPYSYRFLYDSPYYYSDYDSYHGFPYP